MKSEIGNSVIKSGPIRGKQAFAQRPRTSIRQELHDQTTLPTSNPRQKSATTGVPMSFTSDYVEPNPKSEAQAVRVENVYHDSHYIKHSDDAMLIKETAVLVDGRLEKMPVQPRRCVSVQRSVNRESRKRRIEPKYQHIVFKMKDQKPDLFYNFSRFNKKRPI